MPRIKGIPKQFTMDYAAEKRRRAAVNEIIKGPRPKFSDAYNAISVPPPRPMIIVQNGGGEKKGMDTSLAIATPITNTVNTNEDCIVLNLVQQGAGSWNRIGRKISLRSCRLRGAFSWTYRLNNNALGNYVRMVVVWDKQPSGSAIPNFNTVFGRTDQGGVEQCSTLDALRYDNMDRFTVLRDKVIDLQPQTNFFNPSGGSVNVTYQFDEYIKLGRREVVFSGQSNPMTIADISTGALYVYFRTFGEDTNSAVGVISESICRLRYDDNNQ